ncbi:MAG: patatin-like phospholipase family protein [Casimicrobiaceae bacterium]
MAVGGNSAKVPTALVLTGGGARAAYQVGVLRALAELSPSGAPTPFKVVCGTSAGAINATAIAADAGDFRRAVGRLVRVWKDFHASQVYRSDMAGMGHCAARWFWSLVGGGMPRHGAVSLLDNGPLARLLAREVDFSGIAGGVANGDLAALAVTASGYSSGHSVSFFQGQPAIAPWQRARRLGVPAEIGIDHLMASAAIPFMFPPTRIGDEYFGDGSMRQIAPISPALHLGADRVLVVSVSRRADGDAVRSQGCPSLAQIAGHALNSIFTDGLEADLERLARTNQALACIAPHALAEGLELRHVGCLVLSPSEEIDRIAVRHLHSLPGTVRYCLRGIGAMRRSGSNLASYVLFERTFCRALMRLGHADTMARREEIIAFLGLPGGHRRRVTAPRPTHASPTAIERIAA